MTDNVQITAGTGVTVAADDIGAGILAQRVKPVWGPDGTGNDIDVASGKPLPVQLRSPTGTDLTGTAGTASAAVLTVQGIASGTPQAANVSQIAGAAIAQGHGTAATAIRVELPTDGTGLVSAAQSGTWTVQPGNTANTTAWKVDGSAVTQPVSVATVGHGTAAAAIRVELPTDGTGVVGLNAGTNSIGYVSGLVANPSSVLTRPADTTAYSIGDLVASSTTAGSVVVPSFTATLISAGYAMIRRIRLYSNITTGLASVSFTIEFWSAAPTFTNGDNGAYAVATGAAGYLGRADVSMTQVADGAYGIGIPFVGGDLDIKLASGTSIFWTLKTNTAFTPISGETFTIIPEILY